MLNRFKILIASISLVSALPFGAYAADASAKTLLCDLQASLEKLSATKEQADTKVESIEEFPAYKTLLGEILDCSLLEVSSIKTKLSSLTDLSEKDSEIRDEFVLKLDDYSLYFEEASAQLEKSENIDELKKLAAQILNWRKEIYRESAKQMTNFIFILQGKEAVRITDARLKRISVGLLDAGLLFRRDVWKDFRVILNQAQEQITTASKLNDKAYDIFLEGLAPKPELTATSTAAIAVPKEVSADLDKKEEPETIIDLLKESLLNIKESYRLFGEISKIVRKISE